MKMRLLRLYIEYIGDVSWEDKLPFCVDFSSGELPVAGDGRVMRVDTGGP